MRWMVVALALPSILLALLMIDSANRLTEPFRLEDSEVTKAMIATHTLPVHQKQQQQKLQQQQKRQKQQIEQQQQQQQQQTFEQLEEQDRVAVMISGQCSRFIYRDQVGPLVQFSQNHTKPPKVDVYIVLQCGEQSTPFTGKIETPPYIKSTLDVSDVKYWFKKKRGAAHVEIKLLNEPFLKQMDQRILQHSTHPPRSKVEIQVGTTPNMTDFVVKEPRWKVESRKFYNRHLVYQMTQQSNVRYSAYMYMREDNFFLQPLNLDRVLFQNPNFTTSLEKPFVIVDEPCRFSNFYSDKMYITNQAGANVLFAPTLAEFFLRMKHYVFHWFYRDTAVKASRPKPYQPEAWVVDLLSTVHVEMVNLYRIDARYNKNQLCVPFIYLQCMPRTNRMIMGQKHLMKCPDHKSPLARPILS